MDTIDKRLAVLTSNAKPFEEMKRVLEAQQREMAVLKTQIERRSDYQVCAACSVGHCTVDTCLEIVTEVQQLKTTLEEGEKALAAATELQKDAEAKCKAVKKAMANFENEVCVHHHSLPCASRPNHC